MDDRVDGSELEEIAATVGEQEDRYHQDDQEKDGEQEDDREQRRRFPGWFFRGRRGGQFAH